MIENTFSTRDEAVAYIIEAIEAGGAVADARAEYDVDAIAAELIVSQGDQTFEGATIASSVCFFIDADEGFFWRVVAEHERA